MARNTAYGAATAVAALSLVLMSGCTTKKYVRSQTEPVVQKTNELDEAMGADQQSIKSTDQRAQEGIQRAQNSANQASQSAENASQAANNAEHSAQDAVNRADTLAGVIANLDNYHQVADVSVTFGFDKATLTRADKEQLDQFGGQLADTKNYIVEVTGGADSTGSKQYNYALSDRRAMMVVQYLASKYNVPAHKFYLVGLGKDVQVATDRTAAGRKKNRRVEIQLLSNSTGQGPQQTGSLGAAPGVPQPQ